MKKLLLSILALVAIATGASATTDYGFKMLHVGINSDNYQKESQGEAWSYDPSANVLHLKDGTITTTISSAIMIQIDGDVNPTLTIQVDGNCSIEGTFSTALHFTGNGKHTICGNGTLKMMSRLTDPQVIDARDNTSLTIKDVTINIEAYGQVPVGFVSERFKEVILDYCEMNIKTSGDAWVAFGNHGVNPVMKNCFISNGHFFGGTAFDSSQTGAYPSKEVYIKRSTCVVDVNIEEPAVGNSPSFDCTPNSEEYYASTVEWHGVREGGFDYVLPNGYTYQMGETYTVYAILYPTDGHRFADNEEDVTAYVNGNEAEISNMSAGFVTIKYTFPELEYKKYDLWVGGKQVTELNMDDILGSGIVSYNPSTNTLTFKGNGGTIWGKNTDSSFNRKLGCGIYSEIDGLIIDVQSGQVIYGDEGYDGIFLMSNTTITGNAQLITSGYNGIILGDAKAQSLTIGGNARLLVAATDNAGIYGYKAGNNYYSTLTIKDNSTVRVLGAEGKVCIGGWKKIILQDSHAVTTPKDAKVGEHAIVDVNGNEVMDEIVTIEKVANPYDLNNDGKVSTADIQVIINEMKKPQASQNMMYDLNADGKISTADIQVIINEMKK